MRDLFAVEKPALGVFLMAWLVASSVIATGLAAMHF